MSRVSFIALLLWASSAAAQSPAIDLSHLRLTPDPNAVLATATAETAGHLNLHLGVMANWSHQPLRLTIADEGVPLGDVVADRLDAHLAASIGLWSFLHVGIDLPVVAYQKGVNTDIVERVIGISDLPESSLGDLSFYVKGQLLREDGLVPAIALGAEVIAPTGDPAGLTGEPGTVVTPFVSLSQRIGDDVWALQLGYRVRLEPIEIAGVEIDDELVYRLGMAYRLGRLPSETPASLLVEVAGQTPAASPFGGDNARALTSVEARIGLRYPWLTGIGGFRLTPAIGAGVLPAIGSPQIRVLLGVDWLDREPRGDDDGDRVANFADACPRTREDLDEFADDDGCPDLDNDRDGIPDEDDECPDQPEDKDGTLDRDGCIDVDAPDSDGDGVPDNEDGCPEQDEDPDGFEDWDGCPEEDNDGDGLPDIGDVCPDEAEDMNSFQDDDGCPDGGKSLRLVTMRRDRVHLHQPVRFEKSSARLQERSAKLLDAIASLLKQKPRVRLHVVVRPKGPSRTARRLAMDRAAAIVTELVGRGVAESRLSVPITRWKPRARRVELLRQWR